MSLLKRLQQGDGKQDNGAGPGDNGFRPAGISARRVAPPTTTAQQDTYQEPEDEGSE